MAAAGRRAGVSARWLRHLTVAWLLVVEPVRLALILDAALPRIATVSLAVWLVAGVRIALVAAGIAIARRLADGALAAWRAVALWAVGAIGVTLAAHAAPLATMRAPSEARVADAIAIAGYLALAVVARRAAAAADDTPRDSS